jgi:hypothetical protein
LSEKTSNERSCLDLAKSANAKEMVEFLGRKEEEQNFLPQLAEETKGR